MVKFAVGDRVRIYEELFPSFNQGLFNANASTGVVVEVNPESILPYRVEIDGFRHHPFWFYENQIQFEDAGKEKAWTEANKPRPRPQPVKPAGGAA